MEEQGIILLHLVRKRGPVCYPPWVIRIPPCRAEYDTGAFAGAGPRFEKRGLNLVPNSDTGGATNDDFWKHRQGSTAEN